MKIFILEDDATRQQWLRERLIDHDITIIESCRDAAKFVGPYDLILLDHDLGGRQLEAHEDCGLLFVQRCKDRFGDAEVIAHTYNSAGANAMRAQHRMYVAPFRGREFCDLLDHIEKTCG